MKKLFLCSLILIFSSTITHAAELKIGHFDLQQVISQSQAGKKAREAYLQKAQGFQDEINQRTAVLEKLKQEVKTAVEQLEESQAIPEEIVNKDKETATQFRELQRLLAGYQDELKLADAEMTRNVLVQLSPVVAEFSNTNNFDYLFRLGESVPFAAKKHDVTNDLIKAFDATSNTQLIITPSARKTARENQQ